MSNRLEDLRPDVREKAEQLIAAAARMGFPIRITHTLRTYDEQAHVYAKGRSVPGEPCNHNGTLYPVGKCPTGNHPLGATVTNARPGWSWHNFARAFDVCFDKKKNVYVGPWAKLGKLGQSLGLEWRPADQPHFQDRGGLTLALAREQRAAGPLA